jgi:hypothetical protein
LRLCGNLNIMAIRSLWRKSQMFRKGAKTQRRKGDLWG